MHVSVTGNVNLELDKNHTSEDWATVLEIIYSFTLLFKGTFI